MATIEFLSLADVLWIHRDQITRYGGTLELRDRSLLESAIAQPQATFDGQWLHAFPFEMAAAYLFHLVRNHPFVDGNKRVGTVAALVFLELHGIRCVAESGQLADLTLAVVAGSADKATIAGFFQTHSTGWTELETAVD